MSFLHYLLAWANAPFTVVLGVTLLFAVVSASGLMGLLGGGDGDGDGHDVDHDLDAGGDHDVDADADAEGHDADHDADHDNDHDDGARPQSPGLGHILLGPLGVGKIPFSLVWQIFAVTFGVAGLAINSRFWSQNVGVPRGALGVSLPVSLLAAYVVTMIVARLTAPLFASKASEATSRAQLVGLSATVISSKVTREFGEIRIRDKSGHDLRVVCKLAEGAREPSEQEQVVVVECEDGVPRVAPSEDPPSSAQKRA
jgi:membrane protein implicated in regulation of membrane protease activity